MDQDAIYGAKNETVLCVDHPKRRLLRGHPVGYRWTKEASAIAAASISFYGA